MPIRDTATLRLVFPRSPYPWVPHSGTTFNTSEWLRCRVSPATHTHSYGTWLLFDARALVRINHTALIFCREAAVAFFIFFIYSAVVSGGRSSSPKETVFERSH